MSESIFIIYVEDVKIGKFIHIRSIRICSICDEREMGTIAFPFGTISLIVSGNDRQQHFDDRSHGQGAHCGAVFGWRR